MDTARLDDELRALGLAFNTMVDSLAESESVLRREIATRAEAERQVRALNAELEARVAERTAALREANRELEAFSYAVSHDLRGPLRRIDGFAAALAEDCAGALGEAGRADLERIRAAAKQADGLVQALLQLSTLTRGELRREPVDLSALAKEVGREIGERHPGRRVELRVAEGLAAHADARLLRVVLQNLLENAWKFTARRDVGHVDVGACAREGRPFYFVKDDGAGFDGAAAERLFTPFQRLHHPSEFEGTGIGLATVKRIVARHGGEVRAEGTTGEGAAFYFSLGVEDAAAPTS